jgi:hypothetical protein
MRGLSWGKMIVLVEEKESISRYLEELNMQRSGGAVILMKNNRIEYLFGKETLSICPQTPYSNKICNFLDELSKALRSDAEAGKYPDIMAFAFWIRKGNILKLKKVNDSGKIYLGKGMVYHIAPSNIPVNFAYTFVFGMLAGNSNVVKASSKRFAQTQIICRVMKELAKRDEFVWVEECNQVVIYEREEEEFTEITFADRYSFGIINADIFLETSEEKVTELVNGFYNDTYLMDQNACSAPHLILWQGTEENIIKAKKIFWNKVYTRALSYEIEYMKASDKYVMLCEMAAKGIIKKTQKFENILYVAELSKLPENLSTLRGKFGLFYEYSISSLEELSEKINRKVQTCAVFGVDSREVGSWVQKDHIQGIDRVVPFGKTLDIGVFWDGYDVIGALSRCINLQ